MEFDYFYGLEDAEQYQFYRIPKLLITSEHFKNVSVESKLLYGLMLDRLSLSIKNGWFDSLNRAYIIYTVEDVMEDMHCGNQKAIKLIAELEKKAGLIKKKRQGLGKPSLIYAHNEEDPMAIAVRVMKACCDFYDADWCGILIADLQTQAFIPEIWYELGIGPMQDTLFNDIEFTEEFATWAKHLIEQKPLIIPDAEKIRESNPKEYEAYQRLAARSIMGVPFGQHPLGFMVIRNMKQYMDRPEPLQLACFVAMMMLEQIRRTRMEKLTKMHDKDDGRFRIRYNILGPHNFVIAGKEIYEQDLPHPNRRAWIIMLYMVLHKRPVDQQKLIADNWPDEEVDTARNNMRQAIFRLHNDLAAYHDVKVIDTRSRMMDFSGEVNVTTDADEMEDLYNRAKNLPDGDDKIILLKKAFELYRGRPFIQGEDDIGTWLYTYTTHYNQVYVDLTSALLSTLGHIKDYRCIMDYEPRALEIEPGILTAYYWIIIAADETGNSVAREKFLQKAAEDLIDEENEKLMKLLALQNHMS